MSGYSGVDPAADGNAPLVAGWKPGDSVPGFRDGMAVRFPRLPPMQRAHVVTLMADGVGANAGVKAGQAKWVFPNPYDVGVKPVVTTSVEGATGTAPDVKVVTCTNEYVIVEITRPAVLLGALQINMVSSAIVHITANIPTPTVVMP